MVGDSIATHLAMGDRGTWVTGIWRTWQPDAWRGRFIPAVSHGDFVNGTRIVNGGQAPGFDRNCEPLHPGFPAHPGESMPPFDAGWWSIPVHGFVTTGDLADRSLYHFEMPAEIDGVDLWPRYRSDPDWIAGQLRARALMVVEPNSLERLRLRARTSTGVWTPAVDLDVADALPTTGTDLLLLDHDLNEVEPGDLAFEIRTSPDHVEPAGRSLACLGAIIERRDRETGLMIGSTSCGGDTARSHQAMGDVISTEGVDLHRFYDDDYLRRFIGECGWNTFLITLGTNDLNAQFRDPEDVVADLEATIDRYRRLADEARTSDPDLEPPLFLVVSPATAYADENDARFAALDLGIGALAGDDVAVVHLHQLWHQRLGAWSDYESQLLVDGTHPNDVGAMILADLVWNEIVSVTGGSAEAGDPLRFVPFEYPTLSEGLAGTVAQDIVLLGPGTHQGDVTIATDGVLVCSSHGPASASITGSLSHRCVTVDAMGVEIRDLVLEAGRAAVGGGILLESGSLMVRRTEIRDCGSDASGGGIAVLAGDLELVHTSIRGCTAGGEGGAIGIDAGNVSIEHVEIVDCESVADGGGIHAGGQTTVLIAASELRGNRGFRGGGISSAGELRVTDSIVADNLAVSDGGGIRSTDSMEVLDSLLTGNLAGRDGGALHIDHDGETHVHGTEFEENGAIANGGGIFAAGGGMLHIGLSRFAVHQADGVGGTIRLDCHDASISATEFEAGSASACGAIDIACGELAVSGCSFCLDAGDLCGNVVDLGGNEYDVACAGICVGDLDLDGRIDGADLGLLFAAWGVCPAGSYCRADLNRDGLVSGLDLGLMLAVLGSGGICD